MKNSSPEFPPFTRRQWDLLEELKDEIENLDALPPRDPKTGGPVPEFIKIRKKIDELSVKVLRFALKPLSAVSRRPGFVLKAHCCVGRLWYADKEIKAGFGVFHPDLPPWVKDRLVEWIRMLNLWRPDARDVLRETGIVSIETGIKTPEDGAVIECWELIKHRVLELRGVKDDDFGFGKGIDAHSGAPPETLGEILKELHKKRVVTDVMLKEAKHQTKAPKKRTRKDQASWDYVVDILVEEGLLSKKISRQAFKRMLERHHPDYPWGKV